MSTIKRVAAVLISVGYWAFTLGGRLSARNRCCVVLYYHGIPAAARYGFERQMEWLAKHFDVVPLADATRPHPRPAISITFDDALENVLTHAVPVLVRLRLPATIFAVSRNLGLPPQWDMEPGHPEAKALVMTESQLRALPPELIEVGSHTCTHPHLPHLSSAAMRRELEDSKRELEEIMGRPIRSFSAPYGELHPLTCEVAREAGYEHLVTCEPKPVKTGDSPMAIGRFKASPTDWSVVFRLKAAGAYAWRARRVRRRVGVDAQRSDVATATATTTHRQVRA